MATKWLTLDAAVSSLASLTLIGGRYLRMTQTGQVRQYVLVMALTLIGVLWMLTVFVPGLRQIKE